MEETFDLGQLSPSQQESLQQYTQVTNQEIKDAIPLLRRSQWNVQVAVAKFFDGEGPDPVAEAMAAQQIPTTSARRENLQESLLAGGRSGRNGRPRAGRPDPAPRIVPQRPVIKRGSFVIGLVLAPFSLGYKVVGSLFRVILYIFSFLPASIRPRAITNAITPGFRSTTGRRMLMPQDTAARFKREFEEAYGPNELPFYEGGVAQAHDLAKKDLKFLLVVLMSPEHDDTESFVRDTLLEAETVRFITNAENNIILWGGNVLDSEAYQVSLEYNCTKFPFSALVCLTPKEGSTKMGIIKRLVGPMSSATYLAELRGAIERYTPDLNGVRHERAAREMTRNLRTEQDSAYERSLARDRERVRLRREAEAAAAEAARREREEAEAASLLEEKRQQWKRWRASRIGREPEPGADVVRIALKLPESVASNRVVRRFSAESKLEELYAFVECYSLLQNTTEPMSSVDAPAQYKHEYQFRIASIMPRALYAPSETMTIGEAVGKSGNLIVEHVTAESDDEDE